jgi:hypothetical protein
MQAGTVAVAGYAEAIVDGEVDVAGYGTVTLRPRDPDSGRLGTVVKTTAAIYTAETAAFTALILPVDFVP